MKKKYHLYIQCISEENRCLMSRGHHDIHDFMSKIRSEGYDWQLRIPYHCFMKIVPVRDEDWHTNLHEVPKGTRGAFPATVTDEAISDLNSYDTKYLARNNVILCKKTDRELFYLKLMSQGLYK